ncbi:hypothetical protein PIB30_080823 [Stylosanthes scabra]|uniref:Uncharacterized protein n=1 Tax=Stylosanthes scabra TaxID=79078 RepID=A0ABU6VQA1_9FABA|nr:hypothetical protein [Stylosanthes scabra]
MASQGLKVIEDILELVLLKKYIMALYRVIIMAWLWTLPLLFQLPSICCESFSNPLSLTWSRLTRGLRIVTRSGEKMNCGDGNGDGSDYDDDDGDGSGSGNEEERLHEQSDDQIRGGIDEKRRPWCAVKTATTIRSGSEKGGNNQQWRRRLGSAREAMCE